MIDVAAVFTAFITAKFTVGNVTALTSITALTQFEFNLDDFKVTKNTAFLLIQDRPYNVLRRVGIHKNERYTMTVWLMCENDTQKIQIEMELDRIFGINNNETIARTETYEQTVKPVRINPYVKDELIITVDRMLVT